MTSETLRLRDAALSITDGIAEFSHQRPERRNVLSVELRQDYHEMLDRVESDSSISALIITGSGGSFCAGGDLKSVQERMTHPDPKKSPAITMRNNLQGAHQLLTRLRNLDTPVIAAVDGAAVGAGMSLALVADFVLASERSFFCMSFAKLGLIPDMGALYTVPRLIGMVMARDLLLTARRVGAAEAKQLGLIHSVYLDDDLIGQARHFAARFKGAPRGALGTTKRLLNQSFESHYGPLSELEANAQAVETCSAYHTEALTRFMQKQPALYDWDRDPEA